MAVSVATAGIGTLLQIGDGATPEVFTTIAEVLDIAGPGLVSDLVDVTNMSSPGSFEESLPTILRSGEISFSVNFLPTNTTQSSTSGLIADFEARTNRNWQLVFTDTPATTWSFAGYVTNVTPQMPVAGATTMDVTIKLTGQPTLTG